MGTKALKQVCSPAWNAAGVALGQKKTLARRGKCLDMLGGTRSAAERKSVSLLSAHPTEILGTKLKLLLQRACVGLVIRTDSWQE